MSVLCNIRLALLQILDRLELACALFCWLRQDARLPVWRCRRVAEQHAGVFAADSTHNLVVRLRHNVIRAGLKRISLAYSRISLKDIAAKLGLQNVEDTESIVAKAIRRGLALGHSACSGIDCCSAFSLHRAWQGIERVFKCFACHMLQPAGLQGWWH